MALDLNISKKEKKLLIILGIILVGVVYYEFYNLCTSKIISNATAQRDEVKTKYDNVIDTITNMENQRSKMITLKSKVDDISGKYYPTISEEHLINEIDKMLIDCEAIDGGVEFEPIECNGLYSMKESKLNLNGAEGSMAGVAEEYRSKFDEESKKSKEEEKQSSSGIIKDAAESAKEESGESGEDNTEEFKVISMQGSVKYYGTYSNFVRLVNMINESEYRICLIGFGETDLNDENSDFIKASIGIVVYSLPKLNNEKERYLMWQINNGYGKSEPFFYSQELSDVSKIDRPESDFIVNARSQQSDMPSVSVGRVDDTIRSEYAYANSRNKETVVIELNEKEGKYYYKCAAGNDSVPQNTSGLGKEFVPYGENIMINVLSEVRVNDKDKNSVNVKIINNTNRKATVVVNNDDKNKPRVTVEADKKNVVVSKK